MKNTHILFILCFLLFSLPSLSPAQPPDRLRVHLGLQGNLSWKRGEAAEYLRDEAVVLDTFWNYNAFYRTPPGFGWGLDVALEYRPLDFLFVGGGLGLQTRAVRDIGGYRHDRAPATILGWSREVVDRMAYLSPRIMAGAEWKGISLTVGCEVNFLVTARTEVASRWEYANGNIVEKYRSVRSTTWDQPIYRDPDHPTRVRDYTDSTGLNHGLNPNYAAPFAELRFHPLKSGTGPFAALRYAPALTAYRRSNNPRYSLINGYDKETFEQLNLSSGLSCWTVTVGWTF